MRLQQLVRDLWVRLESRVGAPARQRARPRHSVRVARTQCYPSTHKGAQRGRDTLLKTLENAQRQPAATQTPWRSTSRCESRNFVVLRKTTSRLSCPLISLWSANCQAYQPYNSVPPPQFQPQPQQWQPPPAHVPAPTGGQAPVRPPRASLIWHRLICDSGKPERLWIWSFSARASFFFS